MTEKNKKIIKIIIISVIGLCFAALVTFYINIFMKNNNRTKGLILLSEVTDIRETLNHYHIQYGEYPVTDNVKINSSFICDYEFNKNKCTGDKMFFRNYDNIFFYESDEEGNSYKIYTTTNYDNELLNCVHDKKEKKKGCKFIFGINNMDLEK